MKFLLIKFILNLSFYNVRIFVSFVNTFQCKEKNIKNHLDLIVFKREALYFCMNKKNYMKNICVYCSSSNLVENSYFEIATSLGEKIAKRGKALVFGGSNVGLMKAVANATRENGGEIISIIPEIFKDRVYKDSDEIHITKDLRDRKALMDKKSDAFVTLPGGFGTLDELIENLTLKQLGFHEKPIFILNVNNFFDKLLLQFETAYNQEFTSRDCSKLYKVVSNVEELEKELWKV